MRKEIREEAGHLYSVFFDDNDKRLMSIGFPGSDCWWFFRSADPVFVAPDTELYGLLMNLMSQEYDFYPHPLFLGHKTPTELLWYSDCYCDLDDQSSIDRVSRLLLQIKDDGIVLQCANDCFDKDGLTQQMRGVGFSPCFNGSRVVINKKTGLTLADDFILLVNNPLQREIIEKKDQQSKAKNRVKRKPDSKKAGKKDETK